MTVSPPRALVVEDDPSWEQIISELLVDCGLDVDIAITLEESARTLSSHSHCVAVVDLSLSPGNHTNYDGLLVLDAIRRLDPNCRAILLTGYATVEIAVTTLTDYGAFIFCERKILIGDISVRSSGGSWTTFRFLPSRNLIPFQ